MAILDNQLLRLQQANQGSETRNFHDICSLQLCNNVFVRLHENMLLYILKSVLSDDSINFIIKTNEDKDSQCRKGAGIID